MMMMTKRALRTLAALALLLALAAPAQAKPARRQILFEQEDCVVVLAARSRPDHISDHSGLDHLVIGCDQPNPLAGKIRVETLGSHAVAPSIAMAAG